MPRHILEIGAELIPILKRHGIAIAADEPPEQVVADVLTELTGRATTYRSDLKILKSLMADINEMSAGTSLPVINPELTAPEGDRA